MTLDDDDLAAFGPREVDEDRASGEYADTPALARDAAGGSLTDEQAVGVARWYLDPDAGSDALPDGVTLGTAHDGAMAWIVAVAPVVAAARAQAKARADWSEVSAREPYNTALVMAACGHHNRCVDATEAAVRALDGTP